MPIPTGGLITHLDFSNAASYPGSGTAVYDLTANNNDFAFQNSNFTYTTTYGGEVLIDNSNILQTAAPINGFGYGSAAFSINMWMQLNVEGGANLSMFNALSDTGGAGPAHGNLYFGTQTGPTFFVTDGTDVLFQNTTFPLNTWKMITITKPANGGSDSIKVYIDGSQITFTSSGTSTPIALASSNCFIDSVVANLGVWSCDMTVGEYAIYNIELTSGQVSNIYQDTSDRYKVIAFYDFSNPSSYPGSGTSLSDLSGSGFTLINSTLSGTFAGSGQSKYYSFNGGTDQFYRDNTTSAFGSTTRLYEASMFLWVRSAAWNAGAGGYSCMAGWGEDIGTGGGQLAIWKHLNPAFFPPGRHGAMGSGWATTSYPTLNNNEWLHLGYVIDGTNANVYLNGTLVNSIPQDYVINTGPTGTYGWISSANAPYLAPLTLGGLYTNYYPTGGFDLALAQFYNGALSGTAVSSLYNSQLSRFGGSPPPPTPYIGLVGGRTFGQGFAG